MRTHRQPNFDVITQDYLRQLFDYDEATGSLLWRERADRSPWWNKRYAGKAAGSRQARNLMVRFDGHYHPIHLVIWAWKTGEWPSETIDHKDRDPWNNRWQNLRPASPAQQCQNRRRTSLLPKGVRTTGRGRFIAVLGSFATPAEAHAAWLLAARAVYGEFFSLT
jgi:hypothetical protein